MNTPAASFLFLAQQTAAPGGAPAGAAGLLSSPLVFMGLLFVGMWFLLIAPQRKKQKELAKMIAALKSGDEVITTSGIYGVITNVKDDRFVVRIGDDTKVEVAKAFIQAVVNKNGPEDKR
jgi:preprotein translocase subunit YajC